MSAATVHLQGIGKHAAIRADELRPGDVTVWNYGYRNRVLSVAPKGAQSLAVELEPDPRSVGAPVATRTMRRDRLVAVAR